MTRELRNIKTHAVEHKQWKTEPYQAIVELNGVWGSVEFTNEVLEKARVGKLNPLLWRLEQEFNYEFIADSDQAKELAHNWEYKSQTKPPEVVREKRGELDK